MARRIVAVAALVAALVTFIAVKLSGESRHGPPIEIRAQGSEQALARAVLAAELKRAFRDGSSQLRVSSSASQGAAAGDACLRRLGAVPVPTGRADTANYTYASSLELRLASFVYATPGAARGAFTRGNVRAAENCRARLVVDQLRATGYSVQAPRGFSSKPLSIGDGAASVHIEIPSSYRGKPAIWSLDTTSITYGRVIVSTGTIAPGPFRHENQRTAEVLGRVVPSVH